MNQTNKKLYVGSLPYSVTEDQLRELFATYGEVASVRIITDKFTGQSKGFGFVEMVNGDDAQKAIEALNGSQLSGRTLLVNEARPEQRRERTGGFREGGEGGGFRRGGGERSFGGGGEEGRFRSRPRREY